MSTDTFRRHARACVDAAIHHAFVSLRTLSRQRAFFERLLRIAQARSDVMVHPTNVDGDVALVVALYNFVAFERELVRAPELWLGARGHPLQVVASLASHLFGRYPTPRFLASAWFGAHDRIDRRRWFVAYASGERFRSLALPIAMTRKMEHIFLRTPDHVVVEHALRRAEILAVGGTPELVDALLATRLAGHFDDPERWRVALVWLANCDFVNLAEIELLVDYLRANIATVAVRGRTFESVIGDARDWQRRTHNGVLRWPRSRWKGLVMPIAPTLNAPRGGEWRIVELLDSRELSLEGRAMRHCVASYARDCARRRSSIWSVRFRWAGENIVRPSLTIEVNPSYATIVQMRAVANARPCGWPLELAQRWAARAGLRIT